MAKRADNVEFQELAAELIRAAPPIDLHADPLFWSRWLGYDISRAHRPPLPFAWFGGHVDIPRLVAAHMGAQFFGLVSLPKFDRDLLATVYRQIDALDAACERSEGRLVIVHSAQQLEQANREARIGALLGIEGAHCLEHDLTQIPKLKQRGVSYLGLVHLTANRCGFPGMGVGSNDDKGLTAFGAEMIEACDDASVLVDLAHLNRAGAMQACQIAGSPRIVSHTAAAAVHRHPRNISDDEIRAVANTGGVIGVIFCPRYLGKDGVDAVAKHIAHIGYVGGVEAVALGSDWDGFIRPTRGLEEPTKLNNLVEALLRQGIKPADVCKVLRGNVLRVLHAGLS